MIYGKEIQNLQVVMVIIDMCKKYMGEKYQEEKSLILKNNISKNL